MINVSLTAKLKCEDDRTYGIVIDLFRTMLTNATECGADAVMGKFHTYGVIVEDDCETDGKP